AVLNEVTCGEMFRHVLETAREDAGVVDDRPEDQVFHPIKQRIVEKVDGLRRAKRAELFQIPQSPAFHLTIDFRERRRWFDLEDRVGGNGAHQVERLANSPHVELANTCHRHAVEDMNDFFGENVSSGILRINLRKLLEIPVGLLQLKDSLASSAN